MTALLACIIVEDQENGIDAAAAAESISSPIQSQKPQQAPVQQSRFNIFEKQVELSIRRVRADCFKRLLAIKPDYLKDVNKNAGNTHGLKEDKQIDQAAMQNSIQKG